MRNAATGIMIAVAALSSAGGCKKKYAGDSDERQQEQQERILSEAVSQTGMPAIRNFRERKILKDIIELRDQSDLRTFTYLVAAQTAELRFFCDSVGYGFPAATQYTSPQKVIDAGTTGNYAWMAIPQADPNGLFAPSSAEGTWVMCKDPAGSDVKPVYIEDRVVVSPFRMSHDQDSKAEKQQ